MKKGIKYNKKFRFWVVYKNYNQKGKTDKKEFFSDLYQAREYYNKLLND